MVQFSHPYVTIGKTIALTIWKCASKVMSLLFNTLFIITFLPRSKFVLGQMLGKSQELSLGQGRERWAGDVRERVGELPHQAFPDALLPSHSCQIPKHTLPHWARHHPLLHGNGIQSGGMLVPKERGLRDTSKLSFCLSYSLGTRPCLPLLSSLRWGKREGGGRWARGQHQKLMR